MQKELYKITKSIINEFDDLRKLSEIKIYKTIIDLLFFYFIFFLIIIIPSFFEFWVSISTVILFSSILMNWCNVQLHEASHYLLLPNKKLNDTFANFFYGGLNFQSVDTYRRDHIMHHQFLHNELKDPDFNMYRNYMNKIFFYNILNDLLLITFFKKLNSKANTKSFYTLFIIAIQIIVLSIFLFLYTNNGFYLYVSYLYGCFGLFPLMLRLRTICQHYHFNLSNSSNSDIFISRSTNANPLEKLIFGARMDWHYEHHLLPFIPYYSLKKINKLLINKKKIQSKYHNSSFINKTYQ